MDPRQDVVHQIELWRVAAEQYLRAATAAGTPRLHDQLQRVLGLAAIWGTQPVQAALRRACSSDASAGRTCARLLTAGGSASGLRSSWVSAGPSPGCRACRSSFLAQLSVDGMGAPHIDRSEEALEPQ